MPGLSQVAATQGIRLYRNPRDFHLGWGYPFLAVSRCPIHLRRKHETLYLLHIETFLGWELTAEYIDQQLSARCRCSPVKVSFHDKLRNVIACPAFERW